ncbi:hypothetical protein [Actinokineospora sp. NPDC004072]
MDVDWPSDQPLFDLIAQTAAEAGELMADPGAAMDLDHRLYGLASTMLSVSPTVVVELFDAIAANAHEDTHAITAAALRAVDDSLGDWDGTAAQAFKEHMSNVREFATAQREHTGELLKYLIAAYLLATNARDDLHALMSEWLSVSRKFRADEEEQRVDLAVKIGAVLIAGALAIPSAGGSLAMAGIAAGAAVTATAEVVTALGGTTPEEVYASAGNAIVKLGERYDDAVRALRMKMDGYLGSIVSGSPHILRPLPSSTDVDSPDFRYENFYSDLRPTPAFSADVARERERYVAEKNSTDNPIGRVLGGDDGAG